MNVSDWWLNYEASCFLHVQTRHTFSNYSGLRMAGGKDRNTVISVAKTDNYLMSVVSFFLLVDLGTLRIHLASRLLIYIAPVLMSFYRRRWLSMLKTSSSS